jgi:hypothetical protein
MIETSVRSALESDASDLTLKCDGGREIAVLGGRAPGRFTSRGVAVAGVER